LSPLSPVSSSSNSSASSSRPSSHTRSPRYLPPLKEEDSHQISLVPPLENEKPINSDQLAIAMNDDDEQKEQVENDEDEQKRILREKKSRKLLTPLKPREYSQFSGSHHTVTPSKPRTLNRTPKFKGPPGLPVRRTRSFYDVKSHYTQISDDEAYAMINRFTFNDFILHSSLSNSHPYEETTAEKAFLSKYTYKQICEMIAERVWAEREEGGKVY
jgi:hypothetical protein